MNDCAFSDRKSTLLDNFEQFPNSYHSEINTIFFIFNLTSNTKNVYKFITIDTSNLSHMVNYIVFKSNKAEINLLALIHYPNNPHCIKILPPEYNSILNYCISIKTDIDIRDTLNLKNHLANSIIEILPQC